MKVVIQIVLWVLIIFLGWKLYGSINGPMEFNKVKEARYAKVINNLKDIQAGQLAYKEVTGKFTGSFDSLVRFLDTAQFAIVVRRDTSFADVEKNRAFGIDEGYYLEKTILDTIGFIPVKDSIYSGTDRYKTMQKVPVENIDAEFEMKSGSIERNNAMYSVFEVRVAKDVILQGENKDLILQEKQVQSVDAVNGEYIKVGSLDEVNTSGNWPKIYDSAEEQ